MMNKVSSINRRWPLLACAALISFGFFSAANAHGGGGGGGGHGGGGGGGGHAGGGGGHFGGGGHYGGGHYGGGHYGGGHYGGHYGGGYGRYGGRYGGGWRGGYRGGWGGGWGGYGWGFGAGLGLGLYFSALPFYYSTYWWGGVPYYYADDTFYTWDGSAGEYQTVEPPPEVEQQAQSQAGSELIAYPKNGQSDQQQAKDKADCRQWAATQSGYNPAAAATSSAPAATDGAPAAATAGSVQPVGLSARASRLPGRPRLQRQVAAAGAKRQPRPLLLRRLRHGGSDFVRPNLEQLQKI